MMTISGDRRWWRIPVLALLITSLFCAGGFASRADAVPEEFVGGCIMQVTSLTSTALSADGTCYMLLQGATPHPASLNLVLQPVNPIGFNCTAGIATASGGFKVTMSPQDFVVSNVKALVVNTAGTLTIEADQAPPTFLGTGHFIGLPGSCASAAGVFWFEDPTLS